MPIYFHKKTSTYELAVWQMDEELPELYSLLDGMEERYKKEAETQFRSPQRRKEWIATRVLFHRINGKKQLISYNDSGKPLIETTGIYCHISISHTKKYVAIILSTGPKVGLDVEECSPRIDKVIARFAAAEERPKSELFIDKHRKYYLTLWSAKETLFKANEMSDVDFRDDIRATPFELAKEGILKTTCVINGMKKTNTVNYIIFPAFVLTWCLADVKP